MAIEQQPKGEKELKEQVKEMSYGGEIDLFRVEGLPKDKVGRWINTRKDNLELKKIRGWEPVSDPQRKVKTLAGGSASQHELGDLVLCQMDRGRYEAMKQAQLDLAKKRREGVKERYKREFLEEAHKLGIEKPEKLIVDER